MGFNGNHFAVSNTFRYVIQDKISEISNSSLLLRSALPYPHNVAGFRPFHLVEGLIYKYKGEWESESVGERERIYMIYVLCCGCALNFSIRS